MVIFSYFFEAGLGIGLGLTLGFLPGALILRWVLRKHETGKSCIPREKKQSKVVVTG